MPARTLRLVVLAVLAPAAATSVQRLIEVHRAPAPAEALAIADRIASQPGAPELGIDYLRGDLLEDLGRLPQAAHAFAQAMRQAPPLTPYCRFRLARLESAHHPEIAAGLLAPLADREAPPSLRHHAVGLLQRTLRAGGDCRVLAGVHLEGLMRADRRILAVARAECARPVQPKEAAADLTTLLLADSDDEAAWQAGLGLAELPRAQIGPEVALGLGRTFLHHGEPALAAAFLGPLAAAPAARHRDEHQLRAFELLGLAQAGREAFAAAIATFAQLEQRAGRPEIRARALYLEGRARELAGDRATALQRYVRAANVTPEDDSTGPALLAACRLQWLAGRTGDAQHTAELLRSHREWAEPAAAAALFLSASQLGGGIVGNAPELLEEEARVLGHHTPEGVYWLGRAAELQGHAPAALSHYLYLLRELPNHPLALAARARLAGPDLAPAIAAVVDGGLRTARLEPRLDAWLLLPPGDPRRASLQLYLNQMWARDHSLAPFLRLAPVDPQDWPLWRAHLDAPEERVLALGGWDVVGLDTIQRYFPTREPALAFTAAQRLLAAGDPARALALAQELAAPVLRRVPTQLLPQALRQALYPRPWIDLVTTAARSHGLDPDLLWAVMREASRYDTEAVSPGGGRGLLLLDPGTAQRTASLAGLAPARAGDLFEPSTAVALGAARLAQLNAAFPGRPMAALAAHFASPAEARLWVSWCAGNDPAELFSKIGTPEVRATVARVLSSQAAYRDLPMR